MPSRSGSTAKTLILIGLILQIIEVVVFLLFVAFVLLAVPLLGFLLGILGLVGLLWVVLVYIYSYLPTSRGDYPAARTPTLVFAILSLLTLSIISGILYLIGYVKLGDAEDELYSRTTLAWSPAPTPPPPPSPGGRFCPRCGRSAPAASAYCPACGSPLV